MRYRVAVDVGGTFTDLIALDLETRELRSAKVPSVPDDPGTAVASALDKAGIVARDIDVFFHGTTYGLNIVLEHKGADVALITTAGFRDVLEIRRATWPMYHLHWSPPPPLVPRRRRLEVRERMSADGRVVVPLNEEDVVSALTAAEAEGIGAIAVCLINAYAHPAHESRIAELCAERFPSLSCTVSHTVTREFREYERTVTTIVEATISAKMREYFNEIERFLASKQFAGVFMVTRADGGVMGVAEAIRRPVRTLTSGPASGVMGAAKLGAANGHPNLITIDMGGTSFDAAIVTDGQPRIAASTILEGMPLLLPNLEIGTIGAGGGSIARVEDGGALAVGPESAGAEPGPVAYCRGGTTPTFTDAALASGLIGRKSFLGGAMQLNTAAAQAAITAQIAEPLGIEPSEAAAGIVHVVEANMAALLESITIERGIDPRDYVLYAYGGGGPLVAATLARQLNIDTVVIPPNPGVFSAWGMLTLDIVHDFVRATFRPLQGLTASALTGEMETLAADGHQALEREAVKEHDRRLLYVLDLRYFGQEHTLGVPVEAPESDETLRTPLREAFTDRHRRTYGYALDEEIELVALRLRAGGSLAGSVRPRPPQPLEARSPGRDPGRRTVWHRDSGPVGPWAIWRRDELAAGVEITGPAIVEEDSATTLVPAGWAAASDSETSLILTADKRQAPI